MALPEKYESPITVWTKVIAHHTYIDNEFSWPTFEDFALHAFHLCERIMNDSKASPAAKASAEAIRQTSDLQACRHITNGYKHGRRGRESTIADIDVDQGWGMGRWGKGGWGLGEEQATITLDDGSVLDAQQLSDRVYKVWCEYFQTYPEVLGVK